MTTKEILLLVAGVLVAIFGALIPLFRKLVKKTETTIDDTILELSIQAVSFVEKHFLDKSGVSKKALATELVVNGAKKIGKEITEEVAEKVVEKAWATNEINEAIEKDKKEDEMGK
ncbi:phage holin, LLH family [Streptobacillus moniliformis]|uniref:phage holin, LLH family n=1 Tax=Streptobacillus moniliformis TaxID=34105 RepID=UPI0007E30904|nr:phage holin, LLH family [Streptobacillus moniliformis]